MFFRISAPAELALFAPANRSQTPSASRCWSLFAPTGIPSMLKAPLAKIDIRSKVTGAFIITLVISLSIFGFRGGLCVRAIRKFSALNPYFESVRTYDE